jgi:hypothetical protein
MSSITSTFDAKSFTDYALHRLLSVRLYSMLASISKSILSGNAKVEYYP